MFDGTENFTFISKLNKNKNYIIDYGCTTKQNVMNRNNVILISNNNMYFLI